MVTEKKLRLLQSAKEIRLGYEAQGQSLRYLAEIYDTSQGSIRLLLLELGVKLRGPGRQRTKGR